jgi:threonine synthase
MKRARRTEASTGGDQAAQDGLGAAGLHPHRGATLSAMAESIKAGTQAARLTRWPGLIEHYRRFLPVTDKTPVVTLNEGNTPLIESPALADRVGRNIKVYLKYEG